MKTKSLTASFLLLSLSSGSSFALCDFHDDSRFGAFARHHELNNQQSFVSRSSIRLRHDEIVTTAVNQPSLVNIDYRFPFIFYRRHT